MNTGAVGFWKEPLILLRYAFAAMIQPEITEEHNQIKARRKQYLQRLRVCADRFSVCGALFVRRVG